jgi:3-dehydroquinate synthase
MKILQQDFTVNFRYDVHFSKGIFNLENPLLKEIVAKDGSKGRRKIIILLDDGVFFHHPDLVASIIEYFDHAENHFDLRCEPVVIQGGEQSKNQPELVRAILTMINENNICRHSYMLAIGGGAVLDLAGYVTSIAHRGIRLIRVPTTVLSQNDSGIGVKNSVNAFNKKNFLGTFNTPYAVINDSDFLKTLEDRDWRSGISEAVKVALIKDKDFFQFLADNVKSLVKRDMVLMQRLIFRCAELHLQHIASKDPFETGSSRPLDFGHWAAHKLEQLTIYRLRHGEAVAIGIAIDSIYSYLSGMLSKNDLDKIIDLITELGFILFAPELLQKNINEEYEILQGLSEFREHLGGELTITLLKSIGEGVEVHEMDKDLLLLSINYLN